MSAPEQQPIHLSVVAPAHNEEENIHELVREVCEALHAASFRYEFIIVDDNSTDATPQRIEEAMEAHEWIRAVRMTRCPPGRGGGQSAAFWAGFRAARGELIAVLDADRQNDPADIPRMIRRLHESGAHMVQGDRSHARRDNLVRRHGSRIGRLFRRLLLGDTIRDTGCSLRVMRREVVERLPLEFHGMHRFIPVTARHLGFEVVEMRVNHRPRAAGKTKYGMGVFQRALPGLADCLAVRWMSRRRRHLDHQEVTR